MGTGHSGGTGRSAFAVVSDLDTDGPGEVHGGPARNDADNEVRSFLAQRGFGGRQGYTCFGAETADGVAPSVRDLRTLRIGSDNDLVRAFERVLKRGAR